MQATYKITDSITFVGCNDKRLHRFENLFPLPKGVSYNSYLIQDEKVALLDTVDAEVTNQFMGNIEREVKGREIDYLVIHHMEPDHAANIARLLEKYPSMKLVGNTKTEKMLHQFFDIEIESRMVIVKEGDTLNIGLHELTFYMTPMVHWPEVMVSYEKKTKTLFSADAFGTFGTIDGTIFNDQVDFPSEYLDEARRYYGNIVGKYGIQTQAFLKKAADIDIEILAPLHGPIWRNNIGWFLDKYDKWSRYEPEEKGVLILCGTIYGHTMEVANALAFALSQKGVTNIKIHDVSESDVSEMIADIFKYSHMVLACATYNNGIFPKMADLLSDMKALNLQNRQVAIIQNGTWAPAAGKLIRSELAKMKGMNILEEEITILSAMKAEQKLELLRMADAITATL